MNQDKEKLREFLTEGDFPLKGQCAINLLMARLDIVNMELGMELGRDVIQVKSGRIKTYKSTCKKMDKKGVKKNVSTALKKINDLIGVRVICSYVDDIYRIAGNLEKQPEFHIVKVKDYIKSPKTSGYQSLHLIIEVPIAFQKEIQWMKLELQLRTAAMDYWANLDHQLRYKHENKKLESIDEELKECASTVRQLDQKMLRIRKKIERL